ncbi:neutral/alkaline non-lysosomal ceramidase N-terminal domain-containing protein [Verrucomicrobiota bacterium]
MGRVRTFLAEHGRLGRGTAGLIMLAGFARVDITPDPACEEVYGLGYWDRRSIRFAGVRDPLFVRAGVLGTGSEAIVLVSVDALIDAYGFSRRAAARVAREWGVSVDRVWIACTHAHSTPVIELNRTRRGEAYGRRVEDGIVAAARAAVGRRCEVSASLSESRLPEVLYNRRPLLANGKVAELHVTPDPALIADPGRVDDRLALIQFRDSTGEPVGAWCHFGIHGVCVQCSELISGDCMGRALARVEQEMGDGAAVVFFNGTCGDVDPAAMGHDAALEATAAAMHGALSDLLRRPGPPMTLTPVRCAAGVYAARRRRTRSEADLDKAVAAVVADDPAEPARHHSGAAYERFLLEEERLLARLAETVDVGYQVWQTGDIIWVGIEGEVFTESGLALAEAFKPHRLLVTGYTGGWLGYLPPREAYDQGGYEVAPSLWSRLAPGETEALLGELRLVVTDVISTQ